MEMTLLGVKIKFIPIEKYLYANKIYLYAIKISLFNND